jgi:hypothetical protein
VLPRLRHPEAPMLAVVGGRPVRDAPRCSTPSWGAR